jgi:glutamate N-acetyltransferase/amino-acid N-acetyltransferase
MIEFPKGFRGAAVASGIKKSGLDLTLIINEGRTKFATGVFTTNQVVAAPVRWTQEILKGRALDGVLLNSGGANAATGERGAADVNVTAAAVAKALRNEDLKLAICSTGMIGIPLPMEKVLAGIEVLPQKIESGQLLDCATAIMTTDSKPKIAEHKHGESRFVGIAKGAGMLAPSLATMLSVIMTDAEVNAVEAEEVFAEVCEETFNRIDSDGCTSTNDTVLLLASGESNGSISKTELRNALFNVCKSLAEQLIGDAEGHTKVIEIRTINAKSARDAVEVGRACARNNLLKCALFGEDPNWGRVLAAVGTTRAVMDPNQIDISINGVEVCRKSSPGAPREEVNLKKERIEIVINLHSGNSEASIFTNDLSVQYVHENSAYST